MSAILASGKRNDWSINDILNNNGTVEKVSQYVLKSSLLAFHCAL
jgi:hypothetical protein